MPTGLTQIKISWKHRICDTSYALHRISTVTCITEIFYIFFAICNFVDRDQLAGLAWAVDELIVFPPFLSREYET